MKIEEIEKILNKNLVEIKDVVGYINKKEYQAIRDEALSRWMKDFIADDNATARSWVLATLTFLNVKGFEIKKKE